MHAHQLAFFIIIRYLEPRHALPVAPRGEAAPADHSGVEPTFLEEEMAGLVVQERMLEVARIARGVEGFGRLRFARFVFRQDDVMFVCEPAASLEEVFAEVFHGEVDGAAAFPAAPAAEGVAADGEREAWLVVVVEWAEALVSADVEPEPLRDPLDWEVAKLLKFEFIHIFKFKV